MKVRLVFHSSKQIRIYFAEQNAIEHTQQRAFVHDLQRTEFTRGRTEVTLT